MRRLANKAFHRCDHFRNCARHVGKRRFKALSETSSLTFSVRLKFNMHALFSFQHASTCITNCCVPRVGLAVGLAGRPGRSAWQVGLAGRLGKSAWQVHLAGRLGKLASQVGLAGRLGRSAWQVGLAGWPGKSAGQGGPAWLVGLAGLLGRSAWQVSAWEVGLAGRPGGSARRFRRSGANFWYPKMGPYLVLVLGTRIMSSGQAFGTHKWGHIWFPFWEPFLVPLLTFLL